MACGKYYITHYYQISNLEGNLKSNCYQKLMEIFFPKKREKNEKEKWNLFYKDSSTY